MSMTALAISTGFIASCCVIAQISRKLVLRFLKDDLLPALVNEAIAAAELCACCFELIIIADNFGVAAYAVFLFVLTVWWSKVWGDATACPYTHMEDLIEGKTTLREVALRTWAELMGGCCIYRVVQVFWWFEFAETHKDRAFEQCTADLKVHPYLGALIEGVATLLCRLASKTLSETDLHFGTVLDSFIGTSLVVATFNFSGGYFNPVLATALKWGCNGHTNIEHIIVYWVGACTGAAVSVPVFQAPIVRNYLIRKKKDKKAK